MLPFAIKSNTARSEEGWNEVLYGMFSAKTFPKNTVKSCLCSHVWSTGLCRETSYSPKFTEMWFSLGSLDMDHSWCICGTSRYVASPSYSALLVTWKGKGTAESQVEQCSSSCPAMCCAHSWGGRAEQHPGEHRAPRDPHGHTREATLLQAQFSLGPSKLHWKGCSSSSKLTPALQQP